MHWVLVPWFFLISFLAAQESLTEPKSPKFTLADRSGTDGGQFTVYHGTTASRTIIVQDIEVMIRNLNDIIEEPRGQAQPIVIELYPHVTGKPGAVAEELFTLPESKKRFRFQISVRFSDEHNFPRKQLNETLLRLMLVERGLRNSTPDEFSGRVSISPWIVDGIGEAIAWRAKKGERSVYAAIRDRGGWMEVKEIIEKSSVSKLDSLSRALFRASSGALVMALLAQPEGEKSMNAFLLEAPSFAGEPLALLRKHFPDVNLSRDGLEKWWLTQVAALAEPTLSQALNIPETDAELEKALKIHLPNNQGHASIYGIEAWPKVMDMEENQDRIAALQQASSMLTTLTFRSFPTYRPVIAGYLKLISDFTGEKRDHIPEALDNLKMFREAERRRHERLTDLLDWYHLSTIQEESGEFDDYLRLKKELDKPLNVEGDPINDYLNEAQRLFKRQQKPAKK